MLPSSGQVPMGCHWQRICVRLASTTVTSAMPMRLWRGAMPQGMFLKSQGFASNLSDPKGTHTLEAFCQATGHPYASYGLPVSLENFINYGQWFQSELDLKVEEVVVTGMVQRADGFELTLADGRAGLGPESCRRHRRRALRLRAGAPVASCPPRLCTHSSAHTDLAVFRGKEVVVVGAGPVSSGVGGAAARKWRDRASPCPEAGGRLERRAAPAGPAAAAAAERA